MRAAIDFHSYSQLILRPFGYTERPAPDETHLRAAGNELRKGILAVSGKKYVNQREIDLYPASGTAEDWFYGRQVLSRTGHRVYGYTIELRPGENRGGDGFVLPPDEIVPTAEEVWGGLKRWFEYVGENELGKE